MKNSDSYPLSLQATCYDGLPFKPLFGQPCNHCGLCCRLQLCPVAEIMFKKEDCIEPPCPALYIANNKALCGLVMDEHTLFTKDRQLISNALGIGCGCSMADASTTEKQIREHDEKAMRMTNGATTTRR